jgi:gluconokinase
LQHGKNVPTPLRGFTTCSATTKLRLMIVVVMGVSGSGKTTVGRALAHDLKWRFVDADDFHSAANIARMRAGIPLTDADREPWLDSLRELVRRADVEGEGIVLACSALRRRFRDRLGAPAHDLRYVFLRATPELIARRLSTRTAHFMPAALLASQFETLEEPDAALTLDAPLPPDQLVLRIRRALAL